MKVNRKAVIITAVVVFILLAPENAANIIHNLTTFVQTVLSSFHLH